MASFEKFTLPVEDARAKAREFLREFPAGGYMTIVEGGGSFRMGT